MQAGGGDLRWVNDWLLTCHLGAELHAANVWEECEDSEFWGSIRPPHTLGVLAVRSCISFKILSYTQRRASLCVTIQQSTRAPPLLNFSELPPNRLQSLLMEPLKNQQHHDSSTLVQCEQTWSTCSLHAHRKPVHSHMTPCGWMELVHQCFVNVTCSHPVLSSQQ